MLVYLVFTSLVCNIFIFKGSSVMKTKLYPLNLVFTIYVN